MRADAHGRLASWGRLTLLIACLSGTVPVHAQAPADDLAAALTAATVAVRAAFVGDADVSLTRPVLHLAPGLRGRTDASRAVAVDRAVPEPSSRTAGPVRFVLYAPPSAGGARIGRLTAVVAVRAPHVRTRARVEPRATLAADAIDAVRDDVGRQPFAPLPTLEQVTGATTRKPLAENDVVTTLALVPRPLVASGDEVVTLARLGAIEVRGRAIAAQSGGLGDTVIVVNPDSRKRLHGRVVAGALVEVFHGS